MAFLIPYGYGGRNEYAFFSYLFSGLYSCLKEGFFNFQGLASGLLSTVAIIAFSWEMASLPGWDDLQNLLVVAF